MSDWIGQLRPGDLDDGEQQMTMPNRYEALALYNAERARGLVHTPEWDARMAELQRDFDEWAQGEADSRKRDLRGQIGIWKLT